MLTDVEKKLIEPFVTNLNEPVFGFKNLPAVVSGALFGRYSRSENGARELLAREFLANQEFKDAMGDLSTSGHVVNDEKADAFFGRVLDQYGDDSVAELGGTAIAIEEVSNLLVKIIEDRRIGLSPLEKSSRYVRFDSKDADGNYPFYKDADIMKSAFADEYVTLMNALFQAYSSFIPPLMEHLKTRFPQTDGQSDKSYINALRAQACDVTRYLLPMCTKTNVGLVGNGRAFEYLIHCLRASGLVEGTQYADLIYQELSKIIPAFVRRANSERGAGHVEHLKSIKDFMKSTAEHVGISHARKEEATVRLIDFDEEGEVKVASALAYEDSGESFDHVLSQLKNRTNLVKSIISESLRSRKHRTHKPGRAFEHATYQFEIVCDIGAYRDLQRHRILTQQRQPFTTRLGFSTPDDIKHTGLTEEYQVLMQKCADLYNKIYPSMPVQAQYVVPFGFGIRFTMRMNAREAYHLCELRSTVQGHPSYRFVAQEMARHITKVHPNIGKGMMITWDGYDELSRVASEQRIEQKLRARDKSS